MRSSYAPISANDDHAAITRPSIVGVAAAPFTARLAMLPKMSSVHGSTPPRRPERESTSRLSDDTRTIPSTLDGINAAVN